MTSKAAKINRVPGAAIVAVLTLFAGAANAEIKVGFVNVARLLEESPQAQSSMQALQEEFAPRQREIVSKRDEIAKIEQDVQRDAATMSDAERRERERELRDAQRELNRLQNDYVDDLNLRRNEELGRLQRSLLREVQVYAQNSQYDLIVGDGVLFASKAVDVTQEVLAGLQASFENQSGNSGR